MKDPRTQIKVAVGGRGEAAELDMLIDQPRAQAG